jgi:hypothetical protein
MLRRLFHAPAVRDDHPQYDVRVLAVERRLIGQCACSRWVPHKSRSWRHRRPGLNSGGVTPSCLRKRMEINVHLGQETLWKVTSLIRRSYGVRKLLSEAWRSFGQCRSSCRLNMT